MGLAFIKSYKNGFQLDIVGFLAILGEGSLDPIAQMISLSYFVYLPRLLPAPQTFLRTSRPEKLETTTNATVIGIESGNSGASIHHVAHALHRGDKLPNYTVQVVEVSENEKLPRPTARMFGWLTWLALVGFAMSAALFALSIVYDDGMAMLATVFLSLLSTNTGIANKWSPSPNDPKPDPHSPPGDVVIRYPHGAFIIVKCDERTARYLYFNPIERCIYKVSSTVMYRALSLISTLLLMGGVICLANSTIILQTGFAASYMLINIFYWIGAALPPADHWNLERINLTEIEIEGGTPPPGSAQSNTTRTYTEALWKAIAITGSKHWIEEAGWAPKTPAWNEWLHEAEAAAKAERVVESVRNGKRVWTIRSWDYKGALSLLLRPSNAAARGV